MESQKLESQKTMLQQENSMEIQEEIKYELNYPKCYDDTQLYCLNPFCKFPTDRVCQINSYHAKDRKCVRWTVSNAEIFSNKSTKMFQDDSIEFRKHPMKNILKIANIRSELQKRINSFIHQARTSFQESMRAVQTILKLKMNQILTPVENFISTLRDHIRELNNNSSTQMISFKIHQILRTSQLKQVCEMQPIYIMPSENIQKIIKQIQEKTQSLIEAVLCSRQDYEPDIAMNSSQYHQILSYLTQDAEDHQRMIQKLTALLKIHPKKIYQKDTKEKVYKTKCPFCKSTFDRQFSQGKHTKQIWEQLSDHMYDTHFEDIAYCYSHNITKKSIKQTNFVQLIHLIRNYSYDSLHLIFKSGRKYFQPKLLNHKDLCVDILHSKSNQTPSHTCRYIIVPDHSEYIQLISLLAQVSQDRENRPFIYIYGTKSQMDRLKPILFKYGFEDILKFIDQSPLVVKDNLGFRNSIHESQSISKMQEEQTFGQDKQMFCSDKQ